MLTDKFNRKLDYLRVSVTDKCNLRCSYCIPPTGVEYLSHDNVLRNEEFVRFIEFFVKLGVKKIRFTGGEPFVRKGFIDILRETRELFPDVVLCITTNGVLLEEHLDDLQALDVRQLNVSLDSVLRSRYEAITGRDVMNNVLRGIRSALERDFFNLKINAVLLPELLDEIDEYLDYFKGDDITLRFIERMPFVKEGVDHTFLSSDNFIELLRKKGTIIRNERTDTNVAMMFDYNYRDRDLIRIGVIPALTHKFCSRCNRLRLTCDGRIRTCLLSNLEYDIKTPHRMDMGDEAVLKIIEKAVREKPMEHGIDCSGEGDGCVSLQNTRAMLKIGG
jgi:cyclic pyranopterin phosphate synthase